MKLNGLAARVEKLEQRSGASLIVAILNEGETEAEGRQRVIIEGGYRAGPQPCIVMGTELDARL